MATENTVESGASALALKEKGNEAFRAGDYAAAERFYSEGIAADPKCAQLYSNRSATRANLGRHADALSDANEACILDPAFPRARVRKIATLTALGRHEEAAQFGDAAVAEFPNDVAISVATKRAKEAGELAVKSDVVDFAVNKSIAEAAVRERDYTEAEKNYAKAIATMESLVARMPPEQAAPIQAQIDELRAKMQSELGTAQASTAGVESSQK